MSHVIRVDDEVFATIQANSTPLVDSANSTLRRMLGLDPDPDVRGRRVDGALKPLVDEGVIRAGDRLEWRRPKVGEIHHCTVDEDGWLISDDGSEHASPSGAAVAMAGGSQPGWNVWTHIRSGHTLHELRMGIREETSPAGDPEAHWRRRLADVLEILPRGAWTSYGDLGRLVDRHPREVGNYLAGSPIENAFRVLQHTGKVSPQFRWADGDGPNVYERLRDVGVRLSPALVADPEQRLHVQDLQELTKGR